MMVVVGTFAYAYSSIHTAFHNNSYKKPFMLFLKFKFIPYDEHDFSFSCQKLEKYRCKMARDIGRPHIVAARDSCRVKRERINAGIRNQNPGTIFLA